MASPNNPNNQIEITSLPLPQLQSLKSQLDAELTHLSTSYQSLRSAQSQFRDCLASLAQGLSPAAAAATAAAEKPVVLVPLTSSLYVPGKLIDTTHVLVDVGTGFFVEKEVAGAMEFYERKVGELGESLRALEGVVQGKAQNVRVVEEVMRVKVLGQQEGEGKGEEEGGS